MLRSDDALVAHVRRGDETAFEVLFDRYGDKILAFCRHMLGSREAAEDAAQQAFASAYADLLASDREIRFKPWLYTIARNRCLSMLRAARESPEAELDGETIGLHEEVQRRADLRDLLADLHDLPDDQRAALVLGEIADLSHAEIASVLGVEAAKVKGLVFRARSGLLERREARERPCEEIRERLANLRGGALRAGALRHHLRACPSCRDYLDDVRRQRKALALVLPVVPTVGYKNGALAAAGIGAGTTGGGLTIAGLTLSATAVKVATVATVATVAAGTAVGVERALLQPPVSEHAAPAAQEAAGERSRASDAPVGPARGNGRAGAPGRDGAKGRNGERGRSKGLNPTGRERGRSGLAPGRREAGTGRDHAPGRNGSAPTRSGTTPGRLGSVRPTPPAERPTVLPVIPVAPARPRATPAPPTVQPALPKPKK